MPDISMCSTSGCSVQDKCYRKQAKPSERQSMSAFPQEKGKPCEYFIPIRKGDILAAHKEKK